MTKSKSKGVQQPDGTAQKNNMYSFFSKSSTPASKAFVSIPNSQAGTQDYFTKQEMTAAPSIMSTPVQSLTLPAKMICSTPTPTPQVAKIADSTSMANFCEEHAQEKTVAEMIEPLDMDAADSNGGCSDISLDSFPLGSQPSAAYAVETDVSIAARAAPEYPAEVAVAVDTSSSVVIDLSLDEEPAPQEAVIETVAEGTAQLNATKPARKPRMAKKALVAEAAASEALVDAEGADNVDAKEPKKRKAKKEVAAEEEFLGDGEEVKAVKKSKSKVVAERTPDILRKISEAGAELVEWAIELRDGHTSDNCLDVDGAIERLFKCIADVAVVDGDVTLLDAALKTGSEHIIARCVQGSTEALSTLTQKLAELYTTLIAARLEDEWGANEDPAIVEKLLHAKTFLPSLWDSAALHDCVVKGLAVQRKEYGIKKQCNVFEDIDIRAARVWELNDATIASIYDKSGQDVIKENKKNRRSFGEGIRSQGKLMDYLEKDASDIDKIALLENNVSKAKADILKNKVAKKAADEKKAALLVAAQQKEEAKLAKLREKEEEAAKKREAAAQTKKRSHAAKEEEAAAAKPKVTLFNFLKPKVQAAVTPFSDAVTDSGYSTGTANSSAPASVVSTPAPGPTSLTSPPPGRALFRRRPRVHISLKVPVDPKGFTSTSVVEFKEVWVDPKIRIFSFAEDMRPPYVGTFSKKSSIPLKKFARRPFEQDHKLFNYDYDSEGEWEEESEGEDIAESVGDEEDEGNNEMEYDEFFLRDNDYGSDVDSDGECIAAPVARKNLGADVEAVGPRFFTLRDKAFKYQGGALQMCAQSEKDFIRLQNHFSVKHKAHLPSMNAAVVEGSADRARAVVEPAAEKKAKFGPESTAQLAELIHGKKDSMDKLVQSFVNYHADFSKNQVQKKIKEIATKTKAAEGHGSERWMVTAEAQTALSLKCADVEFTPAKVKTTKRRIVLNAAAPPEDHTVSSAANEEKDVHPVPDYHIGYFPYCTNDGPASETFYVAGEGIVKRQA